MDGEAADYVDTIRRYPALMEITRRHLVVKNSQQKHKTHATLIALGKGIQSQSSRHAAT